MSTNYVGIDFMETGKIEQSKKNIMQHHGIIKVVIKSKNLNIPEYHWMSTNYVVFNSHKIRKTN